MQFNNSKLYGLSNKKLLADILSVDKKSLKNVSLEFLPYKLPQHLSTINGKQRDIYNPNDEHKKALRKLVRLLMQVELPSYVFGGIKEKSHIQNASIHKANNYLMLIDIQNFFPSTLDSYVYDLFKGKFQMADDIAKILTDFVTIPCEKKDGRYLPQGYPTSPILSYLAYVGMYNELATVAVENEMIFSCYYDDLTFSSNKFINKSLKRKCYQIIEKHQLKVHPIKSKLIVKKGVEVTGVFLDDLGEAKAPKKLLKKLQESYEKVKNMDRNPSEFTKMNFVDELNKLQGLISAVKSIEKNRKIDLFLNELKFIRKKYNVPYRKNDVKKYFNTEYASIIR
ncbi:reverse transcriptase family protein [Psychrobacillus sp. OK032]|uniref:reverse transcriptase family protein n=1 Tax=Psychrobacillus sp. OK032 TaxID=1884358 RepID=UPI0008B4607F|nr:reverse transcriptase family protein [Psychrobacillus sp. OK032]SES17700.1 Reverse transcriptase (RNA-dependent DNA polymerase) [Psychrobacillus sp. OK032]